MLLPVFDYHFINIAINNKYSYKCYKIFKNVRNFRFCMTFY